MVNVRRCTRLGCENIVENKQAKYCKECGRGSVKGHGITDRQCAMPGCDKSPMSDKAMYCEEHGRMLAIMGGRSWRKYEPRAPRTCGKCGRNLSAANVSGICARCGGRRFRRDVQLVTYWTGPEPGGYAPSAPGW